MSAENFTLPQDPLQERLNSLIKNGAVEVIDPDILVHSEGTVEYRSGDQFTVHLDAESGEYRRVWPSRQAYVREAARELIREGM